MMKKLLILFFLTSCAISNSNDSSNKVRFDFKGNLNFEDFNQLLIQYAKKSPYPKINQ